MRVYALPIAFLLLVASGSALAQAPRNAPLTLPEERAALHRSADWQLVSPHLPQPDSANEAQLEMAGDVLRARRFPEDALDYYGYAMARGGNVSELLNKMGVVRLELRQLDMARVLFERTVRAQKKNAVAWNNLGVTEYASRNDARAISDYKRATRLSPRSAVYHSNLAMAYFQSKDMESARVEFARAIQLDPQVLQGGDSSGTTAHVLGTDDYGSLCFEMAQLYAGEGKIETMRLWLSKSAEAGFDVRSGMARSSVWLAYRKDPAIAQMLLNAAQIRAKNVRAASVPSLEQGKEQAD